MSWYGKLGSFKQEDKWAPKYRHLMHLEVHTWITGGQGQTGNSIHKNNSGVQLVTCMEKGKQTLIDGTP